MASLSTPLRYKHRLLTNESSGSLSTEQPPSPVALKDRLCTYLEIAPFVFLLASAADRGRQCVVELVHMPLDGGSRSSSRTDEPSLEEHACSSAASLPPALRAAFRIPKVIELDTDDEGFITTLELLPDTVRSSMAPPAKETVAREALSPLSDRRVSAPDVSALHVHLFIGTSNGTMLVANALRGTLLAVAQFQYHHDMLRRRQIGAPEEYDEADAEGAGTTGRPLRSQAGTTTPPTSSENNGNRNSNNTNEAVVRFVSHVRSADAAWNPSLLNGVPSASSAASAPPSFTPPPSSIDGAHASAMASNAVLSPDAVYVIHSGGKIVRLDRRALDVFVRVCANRLDGRRPHLSLEWVTSTISTAFPVAGPALDFAGFVQCVYTAPAPAHYTDAEKRTLGVGNGEDHLLLLGAHPPGRLIHDAAFFAAPCGASCLTAPLVEHTSDVAGILLCGRFPAFAAYLLEQQRDAFSAGNAMKAVASAVTGMAKNLWRSAIGASQQPAPMPRLTKRPQRVDAGVLAADTAITSVLVDPMYEWAALGYEGGGRIYLVDLHTGAICRVLKGCRAAQFHWTSLTLLGKRVSALVVHLPLRKLVEVHTVRVRGRIAACHVDSGAVLLRPPATPSRAPGAVGSSASAAYALLMGPSGDIQHLHIDLTTLERQVRPQQTREQSGPGRDVTDAVSGGSSVLAACRTPDDFFDLGLQIPLPVGPFFAPVAGAARYDEATAFAFRGYKRRLSEVCEAVKRRFAPGYAESRTIPRQGPSKSLTAAQCLNYLQLRSRLVECYAKLLTSPGSSADDLSADTLEKRWGGVVTAPLWSSPLAATPLNRTSQKFWTAAVQSWCAADSSHTAEWAGLKKIVLACLKRVETPEEAREPEEEDAQLSPKQFLSYFYCGEDKPRFLFSHQPYAGEKDDTKVAAEQACYEALGRLLFAGGSMQAFVMGLTDITALGLDIADLACIVLTWLYRTCRHGLAHFLATNSLGALCFVMQLFPDNAFVAALAQVSLVLSSPSTADGIVGLVLCVLARQSVKPSCSDAFAQSVQLLAQQLVGLHGCLEANLFSSGSGVTGDFAVPLERLLPRYETTACDTIESLYLQRGAAFDRVVAVSKQLPRGRAEKGALTLDYLLLERCVLQFQLPPTTANTDNNNDTGGWSWVTNQTWDTKAFTAAVVDPLRSQWKESEPAGTTTRRPESEQWALFSQCCVLAYALTVVDRAIQPLTDPMLTFWDFNSVPASNFLERAQREASEGVTDRRWLVGDAATRAYLSSVRDVALFAQSCARSVFGRYAETMRVVTVIQAIAACLTADEELAFPLAPRTLRNGLRFVMHLSGFNSEMLPYRLQSLLSLLQLLIFWVDLGTLGASDAQLTTMRKLSVPWRDLYGTRDRFFVFFPASAVALLKARGDYAAVDPETTFTTSLALYSTHMTTTNATAASILARCFVAAFEPTDVALASQAWLDNHVVSSGVDRLSAALGLQDIVPGFSRLVLLDAMIKRLRPPEQLAACLLSITDRGLAARVTVRDLGAILACVLKYFSQQRKLLAAKQQRGPFDQLSLRMNGVLTLMSQPCRQWVKGLLPGSAESQRVAATTEVLPDDGSTASLERAAVGGGASWFGTGEMDTLYARVDQTVRLPKDDAAKKSFFELLFRLAQLSVEGKSRLSRDERRIVDELPGIAEGIVPFLA